MKKKLLLLVAFATIFSLSLSAMSVLASEGEDNGSQNAAETSQSSQDTSSAVAENTQTTDSSASQTSETSQVSEDTGLSADNSASVSEDNQKIKHLRAKIKRLKREIRHLKGRKERTFRKKLHSLENKVTKGETNIDEDLNNLEGDANNEEDKLATEAEDKQEEPTADFKMDGTLLEIGSTDVPTEIILRTADVDYTVEVDGDTLLGQRRDQTTTLADWIPGDQLTVWGTENKNTGHIVASLAINHSIAIVRHRGLNGWIQEINKDASTIKVQWRGKLHDVKITDNTRIVKGLNFKATIDNLQVGDRIRARLLKRAGSETPEAKIIVVLRHGKKLYVKIRTWVIPAELVDISSTEVPADLQVKLLRNAKLKSGDVNNLIGDASETKTLKITEDTRLVRRYFGRTTLSEFTVGDHLQVVGRVNDDGTITAKLVKNNSIWKTSTKGRKGIILRANKKNKNLTMKWKGHRVRVDVTDKTKIVELTDEGEKEASFDDIKRGDFVRGWGVKNKNASIIRGDLIVILPKHKVLRDKRVKHELEEENIDTKEVESSETPEVKEAE